MARAASRRARRTWPQRLVLAVNVVAIVAALGTAATLSYLNHELSQVQRVDLGREVLVTDVADGEPQNYLIVGADSSAGLDADEFETFGRNEQRDGIRTDTIMILRIEPGNAKAQILSLPRDLWLPIAGTGRNQRINTAIDSGGPQTLVRTISDYFQISINHYMQVDFAGFKKLVDAVDGVPVYFPEPVRDTNSGLNIPDAGCQVLDGGTALAFARSRYYQAYRDGKWRSDPQYDLSRIQRQQFFIQRALQRAIDKGARNPGTLKRLVELGTRNVMLDDDLRAIDLIRIGQRFKDFDPESLETFSLPVEDAVKGGAAVLDMLVAEAQPILNRFRSEDRVAAGMATSGVRVQVLNGSGVVDQAADVSTALASAGFVPADTGDAGALGGRRTTLRFLPGKAAAARLVARYLEEPVAFDEVADGEADVTVVTGPDFTSVLDEPKPEDEVPLPSGSTPEEPGSTTTTAAATGAPTPTTQPPATTTTTQPEDFVPDEEAPGGGCR